MLFLVAKQFFIANLLKTHFHSVQHEDKNSQRLCFALLINVDKQLSERKKGRIGYNPTTPTKANSATCAQLPERDSASNSRPDDVRTSTTENLVTESLDSERGTSNAIVSDKNEEVEAEAVSSLHSPKDDKNYQSPEILVSERDGTQDESTSLEATRGTQDDTSASKSEATTSTENVIVVDSDQKGQDAAPKRAQKNEDSSHRVVKRAKYDRGTSFEDFSDDDDPDVIRAKITILEHRLKKAKRKREEEK